MQVLVRAFAQLRERPGTHPGAHHSRVNADVSPTTPPRIIRTPEASILAASRAITEASISGSPDPTMNRSPPITPSRGALRATAVVGNRNDDPNVSSAAIEVSSFWLEAGMRPSPPRCRKRIRLPAPTATETSDPPTAASIARVQGAPDGRTVMIGSLGAGACGVDPVAGGSET